VREVVAVLQRRAQAPWGVADCRAIRADEGEPEGSTRDARRVVAGVPPPESGEREAEGGGEIERLAPAEVTEPGDEARSKPIRYSGRSRARSESPAGDGKPGRDRPAHDREKRTLGRPRRNRSTRRPTKIDVAEVKTVPGRTPLSIVKMDHRTRIAVRASLGPTTCPKSPPGS
jgi:hypothetical protein